MKISWRDLKITSLVALPFVIGFGGWWYSGWYKEYVKSHPKMYVYETWNGPANPAFYVDWEYETDSLVQFYRRVEANPKVSTPFSFPPSTFPIDTYVYIMGYNADSTVADVICYAKWKGKSESGHYRPERGYVYVRTLHSEPPPPRKDK